MHTIHVNEDLVLTSGTYEYAIEADRPAALSITASGNCEVFIRIRKADSLKVRTFTSEDSTLSVLFWNECETHLDVEESHEVLANASVSISHGEINRASTTRHTYVALRQQGAQAVVSSASFVQDEKHYVTEVVNYAPHTNGMIKNYAVVLKDGRLNIDAVGKIVKGACGSESHQTSRALSFEPGQNTTIVPELLIDENDVQASHAMSMGSVDPDHLYYLQTRGLSIPQCVSLIASGYLMPIVETVSDENLRNALKEEMERKLAE
ncbi:MAG: SufD family Fe-S cluster assembly protein [Bulleidia sp.]